MLRQSLLMKQELLDISIGIFWYLIADDFCQHFWELNTHGFIQKCLEAKAQKIFNHIMHRVQQFSQLIKSLPVLAGVPFPLDDGLAQLLDVRHADLLEQGLALQAFLGNCREEEQGLHAEILLVGDLEAGELSGHHEHVFALFIHTGEIHPLLVNDQVWSKAQQVAIGLLVGPPA